MYIKEGCKLTKIDSLVRIIKYSGNQEIQIVKPKFELVRDEHL